MTALASSKFPSTNNQLRTSSNMRNQATLQDGREGIQGRLNVIIVKVKDTWLGNALSLRGLGTLHSLRKRQCWLKHKNLTEDLDAYDFDCDDVSNAKAVLMANLSNYGSSQRIKPTMYDGIVISSQHTASLVIDDEETLILEEVSRSKMLAKQNDLMSKDKQVNTTPINYVELNRLSKDFGKRFVLQQELSAEQAFWLQTSHPNTNQSDISPVKIEAHRELHKVSLINTSLKKLKYHLGKFDTVVKKRITPDAITEGEWGFEHTKVVFLIEIIPFLKTLKYIFNVFDKDIPNEKVMLTVMNSTTVDGDSVNVEMQSSESCYKCFDLDAELLKKQNAYNALLKSYSHLEKYNISLELSMQLNQ
ncbi:hypothetical protein Tco_1187607 [Tanacetum coccineum]